MERLLSNTLTRSTAKQSYKSLAAIQSTTTSSQLVDILISNVWPSLITQFSSVPLPASELGSTSVLDDVIRHIKPRYHFTACGGRPPKFWEREPFVWDDEQGRISRFISLGAFGSESVDGKKQRVSWQTVLSYLMSDFPVLLVVLRILYSAKHGWRPSSTSLGKYNQKPISRIRDFLYKAPTGK